MILSFKLECLFIYNLTIINKIHMQYTCSNTNKLKNHEKHKIIDGLVCNKWVDHGRVVIKEV